MRSLKKKTYEFIDETVYMTVLDNGMTVYLLPKPDFKETSAMLTVDYGSIDTKLTVDGEIKNYPEGLAHFLEHQLFEREDSVDVAQIFTRLGADSNAFTTFEKTSYYFSTTTNPEESIKLLQEFIVNPKFTELSIEKEKGIILQEIEMYQDDPDFRLYSGLLKSLYPRTPLSEDIAGSQESIDQIDLQDLQDTVNFFYQPDNCSLILVGPFDVRRMHHFLLEHQVMARPTHGLDVMKHHLSQNPVLKSKSIRMDISIPKLAIGFRGPIPDPSQLLKQKIALRLLFSLLFGWTSKTYQDWYDFGKINDSFDIEIEVSPRFQFAGLLMDTNQPIAMVNQIKQVIRQFPQNADLTEEHLLSVKKEFYGEFIRSLDSIEDLSNQFLAYSSGNKLYYDIPEILQELSLQDIVEIGQTYFNQSELTDFTILPK